MIPKRIGEQLAAARKACGMTQEQLSDVLNVSRQAVSHWETGRSLPDVEMLRKLSELLHCNFLTGEMDASEPAAKAEAADTDRESAADGADELPADRERASGNEAIWKQPVLYLSIAIVLLAVTVMIAVLGGQEDRPQPVSQLVSGTVAPAVTGVPGNQAEVRIIPNQNPITPSIDPVLGTTPWWIYHLTFQETAGVDFAIETLTQTMQYRDGMTHVVTYGADSVEAFFGSNVLRKGQPVQLHAAEPLRDYASFTIRIDGTDARGNVLAFECVVYTELPEPTAIPEISPDAKACLNVKPMEDPVLPIIDPELGPNPMWIYTFNIYESAGVPLTLEKITQTLHYVAGDEIETFDSGKIRNALGTNQVEGGMALPWTGGHPVYDLSAVTLQVEAVDFNGHALTAEATVTLLRDAAE